MSQFTCISCRVAFADADIQRQHYKTDWHRYNLKRKVVNLAPVTAEDFSQRVIHQRQKDADDAKDTSTYCKLCKKSFASKKAFENHENSKRHKELLSVLMESSDQPLTLESISEPAQPHSRRESEKAKGSDDDSDMETDSEVEEVDSDEWEDDDEEISPDNPILSNNCLFCTHHSATMTKNLRHMSVEHSFFIPDIEFIVDLRGFLLYLGEKVCRTYTCLWCNFSGREFQSVEAAQKHMRDKGHCKVLNEGASLVEYDQFYNYSSSYPDQEDGMDIDEEIKDFSLDGSDFQLTLPSGATIGHRSLMIYYKQNFGSDSAPLIKKNKVNKVIASYRAIGWKETDTVAAAKKAKDIKYMRMVQNKYFMQLGVKANKFQKHFRPQVNY
uniref:Zinc finger protein 622 n=1 Tax=Lygus hesperus TaxID=30085 RepID=A0A0A9ZIZ0_LYGHE